jgi:hypothetical protein
MLRYTYAFYMNYATTTFAAALHDTKNAALYFDFVLPFEFGDVMHQRGESFHYSEVLKGILPPGLLDEREKVGIREEVIGCIAEYIVMFPHRFTPDHYAEEELADRLTRHLDPFIRQMADLIPLAQQPLTDIMLGPPDEEPSSPGDASPSLILHNLALVDVDSVSWPHLLEFRKDRRSVDALRRLRMFVYANYDGKSRAFIEDDLRGRMVDYEAITREWGFSTFTGSLKALVDSKTILATLATTVGTLFGAPLSVVMASAAAGIALDVAGISLSLAERRHAIDALRSGNPVAYLIEAQRLPAMQR